MVDHERLVLNGGVWDQAMAGYLVAGDLERGDTCEVEAGHVVFEIETVQIVQTFKLFHW